MCGIVVSIAIKGAEDVGMNKSEGWDVWETLVRLNTPRGEPSFTSPPIPHDFFHLRILTEYAYIGPDYQQTVTLEVSSHLNMKMFASVLHLRGGQITKQPHVAPSTGDMFCWNGEVGSVFPIRLYEA